MHFVAIVSSFLLEQTDVTIFTCLAILLKRQCFLFCRYYTMELEAINSWQNLKLQATKVISSAWIYFSMKQIADRMVCTMECILKPDLIEWFCCY